MELKNFYAIIYVRDNVLRTRFVTVNEWKNRHDIENRGYFLIQTELMRLPLLSNEYSIEQATQQLERLVKIIYRRYFLFHQFHSEKESLLILSIKEVENEYTERQKTIY